MVRDDEHLGDHERTVPGEEQGVRPGLRVPRDQDPPAARREAQHQRRLVELAAGVGEGPARRRVQDLDGEVRERHRPTALGRADRDAPRRGEREELPLLRTVGRHRPEPEHPDLERGHDLVHPTDVVEVGVGHDGEVDAPAAAAREPLGRAAVLPRVDQDRDARRLDEDRVTLADVDGGEGERSAGRWERAAQRRARRATRQQRGEDE